jgi:hypothetical protein
MSLHGRSGVIIFSLAAALVAAGSVLAGCGTSSAGPTASKSLMPGGAPAAHGSPASTGGDVLAPARSTSSAASGSGSAGIQTTSGHVGETVTPAAPLVVRDGTVTLGVVKGHLVDVFNSVSSAAESLGGFVASSSGNGAGDAAGASIVVRVPSSRFETLVQRVDKFGKVQSQSETGQDVTGESVNLTARIANLTAEERSLRTLLSHAGSIASILQVQDQLFGVEGEIEQLSAQEGSLIDRATFATLTVELSPVGAGHHKAKRSAENAFVRAVKLAAHNTALAARAVVLAVGWAFPLVVLGLVLLGAWRVRRRITRRRLPAPSTPSMS